MKTRGMIWVATMLCGLCVLTGCGKASAGKSKMEFSQLGPKHEAQLAKQRELVLSALKSRYGTVTLTRTKTDLPVLQRLIDEHAFQKTQPLELQALGVVFGDVLATELGLHWELVTDDYGTDPVLRYGTAQIQVAALTLISKRMENGKAVDLADLMRGIRDTLLDIRKSGDYK